MVLQSLCQCAEAPRDGLSLNCMISDAHDGTSGDSAACVPIYIAIIRNLYYGEFMHTLPSTTSAQQAEQTQSVSGCPAWLAKPESSAPHLNCCLDAMRRQPDGAEAGGKR